MTTLSIEPSQRKTAKIAGVLYLLLIMFGIIAQVIRSNLIVPADVTATASNIMASGEMIRISFMSDLLMTTFYFLWGLALYVLLKPVNKNIAMLMALINFVGAPIMAINMLNQFAALHLLSGADYLKVFPADQLQAMAMFFLNMQNYGYLIAAISLGSYLLPLGYLIFKSGYFPRMFGVLYIMLGFCTLVDFFIQFLFPKYADISMLLLYPGALVEISFCLWLLIKGANVHQVEVRAFEPA
jgi:hypothetical protein